MKRLLLILAFVLFASTASAQEVWTYLGETLPFSPEITLEQDATVRLAFPVEERMFVGQEVFLTPQNFYGWGTVGYYGAVAVCTITDIEPVEAYVERNGRERYRQWVTLRMDYVDGPDDSGQLWRMWAWMDVQNRPE